jgi:hypothetical protein
VLEVPLLGNRVDRFVWNGSTLTFDRNLIALRSLQTDNLVAGGHTGTNYANPAGNHNGGVMRFGPMESCTSSWVTRDAALVPEPRERAAPDQRYSPPDDAVQRAQRGEAGIRILRTRLSKWLMARDFWR